MVHPLLSAGRVSIINGVRNATRQSIRLCSNTQSVLPRAHSTAIRAMSTAPAVGRPIKKDNFKLIELLGDGVSEECSTEAKRILDTVFKATERTCTWEQHPVGGRAILEHGVPITDATIDACKKSDGVFLGAVGHPRFEGGKIRPEQGLLKIRTELNVYNNLR